MVVDFNNSKSNLWYVCSRMLMDVTIVTAETPYLYLDSLECHHYPKASPLLNDSTFPLGSLDSTYAVICSFEQFCISQVVVFAYLLIVHMKL